ncbi:MAG: deoxyribonuclease IV [Thermoplasmatota archaeon]
MPVLGAHVSIAGGIHNSIARALDLGCDTFQIFTRNQRQWKSPPLPDEEVRIFKETLSGSGLGPVLAHDSYLINLGAPEEHAFERSVNAFTEELMRCSRLDIPYLVTHPGSHLGSGVKAGTERVIEGLEMAFSRLDEMEEGDRVTVLLETTAGQGSGLGSSFEELENMRRGSSRPERIGICLDTCHVFAAGYDLSDPRGYEEMMGDFDDILGLEVLKAFHLNDSLKPAGSKVDRHAKIGEGEIGIGGFSLMMNDHRFAEVPMVLETPGGDENYSRELSLLRSLFLG